jgi:hypothetical protein
MAAIDFGKLTSILGGIKKILKIQNNSSSASIPTPLILVGAQRRTGLSPTKIASRIIQRKPEAGIPVGALPSGAVNPDELMWRIAVEEIIRGFQEDAKITVAIPPGTTLSAAGANSGGPVTVIGSTITLTTGYAVIQ